MIKTSSGRSYTCRLEHREAALCVVWLDDVDADEKWQGSTSTLLGICVAATLIECVMKVLRSEHGKRAGHRARRHTPLNAALCRWHLHGKRRSDGCRHALLTEVDIGRTRTMEHTEPSATELRWKCASERRTAWMLWPRSTLPHPIAHLTNSSPSGRLRSRQSTALLSTSALRLAPSDPCGWIEHAVPSRPNLAPM